jgi:hypothetical protein
MRENIDLSFCFWGGVLTYGRKSYTLYLHHSLPYLQYTLLPLTDPLVIRRNILKHKTKFQNFLPALTDGISFGSKRFWAVYAGIVKLNAFCHMNRVSAQWWTLKVSPGSSFCLQSPPRRFKQNSQILASVLWEGLHCSDKA